MLRLYIPVGVAVVLIASLTYWEAIYSDRFTSSSVTAEEFGKRFANVPKQVGEWVGEDQPTEMETLEQAGAVSHVSRVYVNGAKRVDLWLIVGHAREICRHTPDICYPSHGFAQMGTKVKQRIEAPGEEPATFFTAKFRDESALGGTMRRVFWAWNGNRPDKDQDNWEAPDYQKLHFGNNTALYKLYFTADMAGTDEPAGDNLAVEFGEIMIPEINRALFPEQYAGEARDEASTDGDESGDSAAAKASDESGDSAASKATAKAAEVAEGAAKASAPAGVAAE